MKTQLQKWHSLTMQYYNAAMYDSLIHLYNVTTGTCKSYQFEDKNQLDLPDLIRGYFALKDVEGKKTKYFLDEDDYKKLPVRVIEYDELHFKESARCKGIVIYPTQTDTFRITPSKCWEDNHDFIDELAPFKHSEPDYWTLNKITAVMAYVGKLFIGECSLSEFGKSSIYLILDAITKKCPVFQPRSVPGVLAQITSDGNMVFDEVHDASSDVKNCMENFSLQVAGNSPIYINGAMKSTNTRPKYDVAQQSITYLYNVYSNYSEPEKQFWDNIWSNTKAMESRFLRLKFKGKLEEQFDKDFNIPKVADDNKMYYIKIAKHLLYLKQLKIKNNYNRRYKASHEIYLKGRHKILYDEITWGIDLYSQSQEGYDKFIKILNESIKDYKVMIGESVPETITLNPNKEQANLVTEEIEESDDEKVMDYLKDKVKEEPETIAKDCKIKDIDKVINKLVSNGDIYEISPGQYAKL